MNVKSASNTLAWTYLTKTTWWGGLSLYIVRRYMYFGRTFVPKWIFLACFFNFGELIRRCSQRPFSVSNGRMGFFKNDVFHVWFKNDFSFRKRNNFHFLFLQNSCHYVLKVFQKWQPFWNSKWLLKKRSKNGTYFFYKPAPQNWLSKPIESITARKSDRSQNPDI